MTSAADRKARIFLKKNLSPARYRHTMSVARWARALARVHGENPAKAWTAGLLHDAAKEWPGKALVRAAVKNRLGAPFLPGILKSRRYDLLHAFVSADVARRRFGVKDKTVLNAIARHTLGRVPMGRLDQVVYVADFSAPDRRFPGARAIRRLARKNLPAAFRECVRLKLLHVLSRGRGLHPATVRLWNGLCDG